MGITHAAGSFAEAFVLSKGKAESYRHGLYINRDVYIHTDRQPWQSQSRNPKKLHVLIIKTEPSFYFKEEN